MKATSSPEKKSPETPYAFYFLMGVLTLALLYFLALPFLL
jgi:hypothetical protein